MTLSGDTDLAVPAARDGSAPVVLVCRAIVPETPDAKSYLFGAADGRRLPFAAGQFLTVTFSIAGEPVIRCYTIASSSARDATVAITVKRVAGGRISNWLFEQMRVGDTVTAEGPLGFFTPWTRPSEPLLFLSAGSGITPLASAMRSAVDLGIDPDVVFIHAARSPEAMIFRDEYAVWARALPRARVIALATQPRPGSGWVGPSGRLDAALLQALVPDLARRSVFCCGPGPFMDMAKRAALGAGVPADAFHEESFAAFDPAEELSAREPAPTVFDITFRRSGRTIPCPADATIVKAAQAARIPIVTSCGKGICGTCRTKLVSGTVAMSHNGGIKQREIDQGFILACCSRPTSALVLDR
jgi:glycine betaine catabolism B